MSTVFLDNEVAYLLGLLVARGEIHQTDFVIHFPKGILIAEGDNTKFDTNKEIQLGLDKIGNRVADLLGANVKKIETAESWDLQASVSEKTLAWKNVARLLKGKSHFPYFNVPNVLLEADTEDSLKIEFVRGYADVAGNIRPANRDRVGRHRVRLDTMNRSTNWRVPVDLCLLLQEHILVPVPVITWGHPNLNREWREHQLNVYAEDFQTIGFTFDFKNQALAKLADINRSLSVGKTSGCPGQRASGVKKPVDPEEKNKEKLDPKLVKKHFNSYWQICRALGCPRRPSPKEQLELIQEA